MRKSVQAMLTAAFCAVAFPNAVVAGTLFIGTDTSEFQGAPNFLMKADVNGPNFVSQTNIPLGFPLNGLGDGPGFLYAGDPDSNTLNTVDYNGNLLTSVTAGFPDFCCNEEMQFAGGNLYHAHWDDIIQQIDPVTGAVIQTFPQPAVVGMALVGSTIWITHWENLQVGTWDPLTNIFNPVFNTPQFAGALAFDPSSDLLWVGQLGGQIIPYSLTGVQQGPGFNPIANNPAFNGFPVDTIDGLTFQGEGTQVPEPTSIAVLATALAMSGWMNRRRRRSAL